MIQVPADRINLEFVLGNKVMVGTVNAIASTSIWESAIWRRRKRSIGTGLVSS